jgi:hypothetical protein
MGLLYEVTGPKVRPCGGGGERQAEHRVWELVRILGPSALHWPYLVRGSAGFRRRSDYVGTSDFGSATSVVRCTIYMNEQQDFSTDDTSTALLVAKCKLYGDDSVVIKW